MEDLREEKQNKQIFKIWDQFGLIYVFTKRSHFSSIAFMSFKPLTTNNSRLVKLIEDNRGQLFRLAFSFFFNSFKVTGPNWHKSLWNSITD